MRLLRRQAFLAAAAAPLFLVAGLAGAQGLPGLGKPAAAPANEAKPAAGDAAAAAAAAPALEAPIPIPEIASRAEEISSRLRALQSAAVDDSQIREKAKELEEFQTLLTVSAGETQGFLDESPNLSLIDDLEIGWQEGRGLLLAQNETLTKRVRRTQEDLDSLAEARDLWQRTLESAQSQGAPPSVLGRIRGTLTEIGVVTGELSGVREQLLKLQDEAARQLTQAEDTLALLDRHRQQVVDDLWSPDAPPLWAVRVDAAALADAWDRITRDLEARIHRTERFLSWRGPLLGGQLLLGILLALVFVRARQRTEHWKETEPGAADAFRVLELPYSAAAVLTLLSTVVLHSGLPRLLAQVIATLALFPVVRILRPLVPAALRWELYALAAFFLIDRVRDLVAPAPRIDQLLLTGEMVLGIVLLGVILRRGGRPLALAGPGSSGLPRVRSLERLLLVGFSCTLLACVLGYMQLARLLASSGLVALYIAMALYAGARAMRGLLAVALRVRPLVRLNLVQHQRPLIEARVGRWIGWVAVAFWGYVTIISLTLQGTVRNAVARVLEASVSFGTVTFSVGDVAAMLLTLWVSILVSRFVRFVLQEDVFPRVALARGVPYALSNLVGYVIVLVGFVLALTTIGLDASRFTILAGAFGVGIGFGMQNIVNNFVSGLILLFERPIQVSDVVQIGEVMGEVRRIGIRSSTVRTFTGAEVIVPNADLIAERVTNWTLSDSTRRIEIPVGVAYGSDPRRVVEVMTEVARKHGEVLNFPAPMAVFVQFGDSSIDFELRAWVADGTRWPTTRTEVAVNLFEALREAGIQIPFPQREVRLLGG